MKAPRLRMGLRCYAAATTSTPIEVDWNHTEIPSPFGIVEMNSAKVCPETITNTYSRSLNRDGLDQNPSTDT